MKNIILFLAFWLSSLIGTTSLQAYTPPDSCLKLICSNDSTVVWDSIQVSYRRVPPWNPDSVRVDSCPESPTYLQKYANKFFALDFKSYPFSIAIPKDSIWLVSQLKDSITKTQFQQLEQIFGTIYFFRELDVEYPDSLILSNAVLFISFESIQNIDTVKALLISSIDSLLMCDYIDKWLIEEMLVDIDENHLISEIILTPNPASNYFEITLGSVILREAKYPYIRIWDILGIEQSLSFTRKVESDSSLRIDVSHLAPGVYIVQINTQSGTISKKLIIQR